jgi:hypothetical protein
LPPQAGQRPLPELKLKVPGVYFLCFASIELANSFLIESKAPT